MKLFIVHLNSQLLILCDMILLTVMDVSFFLSSLQKYTVGLRQYGDLAIGHVLHSSLVYYCPHAVDCTTEIRTIDCPKEASQLPCPLCPLF